MSVFSVKNQFLEAIGVRKLTADQKLDAIRGEFQRKADKVMTQIMFLEAAGGHVAPLQKLFQDAEDMTKVKDQAQGFENGLKHLKGARDLLAKAEKEITASGKSDKKQELFKNKYLNKKERVEHGITQLAKEPGTKLAIEEMKKQLASAAKLANEGEGKTHDWMGAYEALKGFTGKRKKAEQDAAKAISGLPDDGAKTPKEGKKPLKLRTTYQETLHELERYRELVPDAMFEKESSAANQLLEAALQAQRDHEAALAKIPKTIGKNPKKAQEKQQFRALASKQEKSLTVIKERVGKEVAKLEGDKLFCESRNTDIEKKRFELLAITDSGTLVPLDELVAEGRRLMAAKEFPKALLKLREADTKMGEALTKAKEGKGEWDKLDHKKMQDDLTALRKTPATETEAAALSERYRTLLTDVTLTRRFSDMAQQFGKIHDEIETLLKNKKAAENTVLVAAKMKADIALQKSWDACKAELDKLAKAMKANGAKGEDLGNWEQRAAGIKTEWEQDRNRALTIDAVNAASKQTQDGVTAFVKSLQEFLENPTSIKQIADQEKTRTAQKQYEAIRADVKQKLDALETEQGGETHRNLLAQYKKIEAGAAKDWHAAYTGMDELLAAIEKASSQAGGIETHRKAVKAKADAVKKRITALPAGRAFKEYIKSLQAEADDIAAMGPNGNLDVCTQAFKDFQELEKRIDKLTEGAKKAASNPTQFREVQTNLKDLYKKITDSKQLKKYRPARYKALIAMYKEKKTAASTTEPEKTLADLATFEKTVEEDIKQAEGAKNLRKHNSEKIKDIKNRMEKLEIKETTSAGTKSAYHAELKKKLDDAKKKSKTEDGEAEVMTDLQGLENQIKSFEEKKGQDRGKALADKEKELVEGDKKKAAAKSKFEADNKNFDHVLADVRNALKVPDADPELEDAVVQLRKQAAAQAKGGKYDEAQELLEKAKTTAAAAIQNPLGRKMEARGKLKEYAKQWATGVEQFRKATVALADEIKSWSDATTLAIDKAKTTKVADALRQLPNLFEPTAFDKTVAILVDRNNPEATRKAAREEGLAEVRRCRNALLRDKLLTQAQENPFVKGLLGAAGNLLLRLNNLELNVLTCV